MQITTLHCSYTIKHQKHPLCIASSSNTMEVQQLQIQQQPKRVVVCGGGVIGVCTAYFLSQKGASVTLIEQSSIACAASGKAGGFLALDWCDGGPLQPLARASFNLHRSLSNDLNGSQTYGYRPLTTLSLSLHESDLSTSNPTRTKNPKWITDSIRNPKTIGTPETTAQVHPQLFTRALISHAVAEYGVKVVIGKVEAVTVEDGAATGVVVDGGQVFGADAVVLALGPWTLKLTSVLSSAMFRIYGLKAHSIVLRPNKPEAITPHALFLSYYASGSENPIDPEVYPRPTGEVYICGMSAEAEVPDDPEQVEPDPDSISVLKKVGQTVSTHLSETESTLVAEQACFLPCTDDNIPVIGQLPGVDHCYVATGHNCWGILNGPATGVAVAELVLDGRASIVDLKEFSPARFGDGKMT